MKKLTALALSLLLILAFCPPARAFAYERETPGLKEAVAKVKSVIDIPVALTEFDYYSDVYGGYTVWQLEWYDEDYDNDIEVTLINDVITEYARYAWGERDTSAFGNQTRDRALEKAEAFLKRLDPERAAKMKPAETGDGYYGRTFRFTQTENGVPVPLLYTEISVDVYTGEVSRMSRSDEMFLNLDIPAVTGVISEEQARAAYLSAGGVKLQYRTGVEYDSVTGKTATRVFPVYAPGDDALAIDARTGARAYVRSESAFSGDVYTEYDAFYGYEEGFSWSWNETPSGVGLISSASALSAVRKLLPEAIPNAQSDAGLYVNSDASEYSWHVGIEQDGDAPGTYAYAGGAVDAKTGEVKGFRYETFVWGMDEEDIAAPFAVKVSTAAALATARDFLKNVAPAKYAQTEMRTDNIFDDLYVYRFDRIVDGVPFVNDYLTVTVDDETGKVDGFNSVWHSNATFPDVKNVISKEKAFDILNADGGFGQGWFVRSEDWAALEKRFADADTVDDVLKIRIPATLAYGWTSSPRYLADALSGRRVDGDGKPYRDPRRPYDDLDKHWVRATAELLFDLGYAKAGTLFEPNKPVTQAEFLRWLASGSYGYEHSEAELYDDLISGGILTEAEKAPNAVVSRYDAAKFVVRMLDLDIVGKFEDAFKNSFKDEIAKEYAGYVAAAKALSIMKGDAAGRFGGDRALTGAEAAVVILNMLKAKNEM